MKLLKNLVAVSAAIAALLGFVALILVMAGFPLGIRESNTFSSLSAVMQGDANELTQDVELSHINYVGREAFSIPGLGAAVDELISHHVIWITVAVFVLLACVPWESMKRQNSP